VLSLPSLNSVALDGGFHITTAANVDTLEKTNKVIGLTAKYPIMYGYSEGFYIRLEVVPPAVLPSGIRLKKQTR
jgi:hypothetical protein